MEQSITIQSVNYDGELANIIFKPDISETVYNLGDQSLPFVFNSNTIEPNLEVFGTYTILILSNKCPYFLNVPRLTPTCTPTKTPTRTPTSTPTPTVTPTPTFDPCKVPTPTPTVTTTPTLTPTNTPTPSVTCTNPCGCPPPSNTPTPTKTTKPSPTCTNPCGCITPTPTITPTNTTTPTLTPTNTPTLTPSQTPPSNSFLQVYLSIDSSIPTPFNGTLWYSVSPSFNGTQPYPIGFSWTLLGGAVTIPQCNSSILAGTISVIAPKNIYLQVRDVTGSIIYETKSGFLFPFSDPCLNPATLLYTQSFGVGLPPSTSQFKVMVTSPINTVPAP